MADVDIVLDANRAAVNDLIAAAEKCGSRWTAPRAPGKWSPSQVVEHVALALEESAHVVSGEPSKFPSLPAFVRPLVRGLVFKRVLKKNAFPKAKTNKAMNPASGPATTAEARGRLDGAFAKFERACRERAERVALARCPRNVSSYGIGPLATEEETRLQPTSPVASNSEASVSRNEASIIFSRSRFKYKPFRERPRRSAASSNRLPAVLSAYWIIERSTCSIAAESG